MTRLERLILIRQLSGIDIRAAAGTPWAGDALLREELVARLHEDGRRRQQARSARR